MSNFKRSMVGVTLILLVAAATPATAELGSSACATGRDFNECASKSDQFGPVDASVTKPSSGVGSGAIAFGITDYGINRAYASSSSALPSVPNGWGVFGTGATSESRWSDQLMVSNTMMESGLIEAQIYIHARHAFTSEDSQATYYASTNYHFQSGGQTLYSMLFTSENSGSSFSESLYDGKSVLLHGDLNTGQFLSVYIPFVKDQFVTVESLLGCGASTHVTSYGSSSDAVCDSGNSARWAGITGIKDSFGNTLDTWSLTSTSGTDYTRSFVAAAGAVPEPATWVMLIVGFGAVGAAMRTSRRRGNALIAA